MRVGRWLRQQRTAWHGRFGAIPRPARWLFIVGCYNSGTTLLHRTLQVHPQIGSMPQEGQFLTDVFPAPRDLGLPRLWALQPDRFRLTEASTHVDAARLKRQWGARFNDPCRPVLLEKSPTNTARTRWLEQHFENAHFVGVIRDGHAVAEGIRRRAGHGIRDAARQWRVCNEIMLKDFARLRHARIIRYEDLVADPDTEIAGLFDFIDLPPMPDGLKSIRVDIRGQSSNIRDMNQSSVTALTEADRDTIHQEAGMLLESLGYTRTAAGSQQ